MTDNNAPAQETRIDQTLNAKCVTFCIDTNIFVEFKALDQIPWHEMTPNAVEIRIVILTKVGEELDDHKKKTGRLRRRGLDFAQIARRIGESSDERAVLRQRDPQVTVEFGPIYRRTELDGDLYDLGDKDGRIVAEFAKFMEDHPDAVFLADDSKPLRWARQTGLLWRRPPESWRRMEGPDERDKEIIELKRELGAQPAFGIRFLNAVNDRGGYAIEPVPVTSCTACSDRLASTVLAANPKVSREESIARYGLAQYDILAITTGKLTESDLGRYDNDYTRFEKRIRWWAENQLALFHDLERVLPIDVKIGNDGDRAAERVLVELELTGAFHFVPRSHVMRFTERLLSPPSPPEPRDPRNWRMPYIPVREPPKPHNFYLVDEPKADGSTRRLEWRCEELRHSQSFILPVIVRAENAVARGALKVRVSSAVMAKTLKATSCLACVKGNAEVNRLCAYLQKRISLFPRRYQELIRHAIAAASEGCSGKSASAP